jgi:nucleoside-diphosphate-sugar epimerase
VNVTVFGATGGIGRQVVDQLLAAGHHVTAVIRSPGKLDADRDRLTVVVGELSDRDAIDAAIRDADAVISALGPSLGRSAGDRALTEGTALIVSLMREEGVRRFVGLATPSIPDRRDGLHWKQKVLPVMAKLMFPDALTELRGMTEAVTSSDLDWTIARITNPTNRSATGTWRAGFLGRDKVGSVMSRADIAAFLVAQLTDRTYVAAAPAISN